MSNEEIYKELKVVSTWEFILYTFCTFLIYPMWYMYRQSKIIDRYSQKVIPNLLLDTTLVFFLLSLLLSLVNLFYEDRNIGVVVDALDNGYYVLVAIWSVLFRNKLNEVFDCAPMSKGRFSIIWALVFEFFYFNFKINQHAIKCDKEAARVKRNKWKEWWFVASAGLLLFSLPMFLFILTFITPNIAQMVQDRGEVLGVYSQMIMSISVFIQKNIMVILLGLIALIGVLREKMLPVFKWGLSTMGVTSVFLLLFFLLEHVLHAVGTLGLIEMIPGMMEWISE